MHGEPRSTHDVDLVIALDPSQVRPFLDTFSTDHFYVSETAAIEAVQNRSMFNVLETTSGNKIDFWLLTDEPWDQSRFQRRQKHTIFGSELFVSTPEDTILAKLRWAKLSGGSEKQMNDAQGVYQLQGNQLDKPYIESWARSLGVLHLWKEIEKQ